MEHLEKKTKTVSKKTPECEGEDFAPSYIAKNTDSNALEGPLPIKKIDPFQKEQDHLAEEVVRTVLSDSPQPSTGKEVKLEELIDSLVSNPFLTRKQIPRTPENLISDIRSSWRKAVKIEDNRSTESFQMDTEHTEGFKGIDFGILHETLPEDVGHLSLNSSNSTEVNFKLDSNSPMDISIFPDVVGERQTTPKSDSHVQAIYSRYEALKKSIKKKEETYLFNSEIPERYKLELSSGPQTMQTEDMLNLLDTQDLLTDYTKPSLQMSLGERKQSLSPLIKFSPVDQRLRTTRPCSFEELPPYLKEAEILNKSLDAKESPPDLKK